MWRPREHFNVSKVTRGKGVAQIALYWIYFNSEVRLSVKWDTEVRIICCLDKCRWHRTGRMILLLSATNAMTSDFLLSISHGWVVMFLDSHPVVFTFLSWLDLLGVAFSFRISILKFSKLLPNYWHTDITSFKNIWKVLRVILWPSNFWRLHLVQKFVQ